MDVVIAGSNNDSSFAVVDFTNPNTPSNVVVASGFSGGCMVDAFGTLAAVGNYNGTQVAIFDFSNPASPVLKGSVNSGLSGVGAISIDGTHVLAGEQAGTRAVLIDVSNPAMPSVVSTFNTGLTSISAIVLSGSKAVAAGPNDGAFVVIDYSNPANPTQVTFNSGTSGVFFQGSMTADCNNGNVAVGDYGEGTVYFFDVSGANPTLLGSQMTIQDGVSSISLSGSTLAAASTNNAPISLVSFQSPGNPTETDLNATGLNGGATVKLSGNFLAAGDVLGTEVALFSVAGTNATLLGKCNTTLASIATIAFSTFNAPPPVAHITATPTTLAFGTLPVNTGSALPVVLKNTGNGSLSVSNLHATAPQYVAAGATSFNIAPNATHSVSVTFTPTAAQAFAAALTMTTNDPANPIFSVALSGSGGLPHIVVPPGPLDFGGVAVCESHTLNATIGNTGPVQLTLSQIAVTGAGFSHAGSTTAVIGANGNGNIGVTFAPAVTGPAMGTLTFHSDDPNTPTASIALQGLGTPEPPPAIAVTPGSINCGPVPLQYFVGVDVMVANTGPCEPLVVTLTVTGTDFLLTTGNPTVVPMSNPPIMTTVQPNAPQHFTVVYAPSAAGAATGTLTVTSNDPSNPSVTVALSGSGVAVSPAAVELILDRSGSMATPVTGGTRMTALQSAVGMFADLVIPSTGFAMGSVQFDTQFAVLTPLGDYDAAKQSAIKADANSLTPRNLTSIGGGLQVGQTQLQGSMLPRKVAIVFTDGYQNTPPDIATVEPGVVAAGTEVYAVGLGDPAYLSVQDLSNLAASSSGKFFQTTDPLVLRKQFVEILADAFRQNMAADPIMTLQEGVPANVPVDITQCEGRISFVLLWEDQAAQIQLTIKAPDGTVFTPSAATTNRLVRYVQRPGYRFFQIALPPGPGGTIGPKQLGQWVMQINPVSLPGGATRASTSVMVESALQMTATLTAGTVVDPIQLRMRLMDHGSVVTGAHVKVAVTAPARSLAQISTPLVHARALAADKHLIPKALQILTPTHTTQHVASFTEREYVLELPPPKIDGVYSAEVNATGHACGGVFQRYWSGSIYVGPRGKRG